MTAMRQCWYCKNGLVAASNIFHMCRHCAESKKSLEQKLNERIADIQMMLHDGKVIRANTMLNDLKKFVEENVKVPGKELKRIRGPFTEEHINEIMSNVKKEE